jgi:hypothetical protein
MTETPTDWIPITSSERPERHEQQIWCYDKREGVTTGYFHGWRRENGIWHDYWAIDGEYDLHAVTHWQPLPRPEPPPQEEHR